MLIRSMQIKCEILYTSHSGVHKLQLFIECRYYWFLYIDKKYWAYSSSGLELDPQSTCAAKYSAGNTEYGNVKNVPFICK